MASVLILLAPGAEEIETITVADVLVRAKHDVVVASLDDGLVVAGSRRIPLAAHVLLAEVVSRDFDVVYLPGGTGSAERLRDDPRAQDIAQRQLAAGRRLAVICAAPIALVPRGLARGRRLTSFPKVRAQVEPHASAWLDQPVVIDGGLITSQGPGTAIILALVLVRLLGDDDAAAAIADGMVVPPAVTAVARGIPVLR